MVTIKRTILLLMRALGFISGKKVPFFDKYLQRKNVSIGRHTYGVVDSTIPNATPEYPIEIGSFCSIAPGVQLLSHMEHRTDLPSLFPFRTLLFPLHRMNDDQPYRNLDAISRGPIRVGNDVWLGQNAIVLSGVTIGTGAIVGAGAVVTSDVPAYAIVVGNPARIARYRFPPETIVRLLDSRWWDLSDEQLLGLEAELYDTNIENFLRAVAFAHASARAVSP